MRATYHKLINCIVVELSEEECTKYLKNELSREDSNLRRIYTEPHYAELTIPCSAAFYQLSQRQKGGTQPWGKEDLRAGVRASVANRLVPYAGDISGEAYKGYRAEWSTVNRKLQRNVRLLFPSAQHPRARLTRSELQFRRSWRRAHRLQ